MVSVCSSVRGARFAFKAANAAERIEDVLKLPNKLFSGSGKGAGHAASDLLDDGAGAAGRGASKVADDLGGGAKPHVEGEPHSRPVEPPKGEPRGPVAVKDAPEPVKTRDRGPGGKADGTDPASKPAAGKSDGSGGKRTGDGTEPNPTRKAGEDPAAQTGSRKHSTDGDTGKTGAKQPDGPNEASTSSGRGTDGGTGGDHAPGKEGGSDSVTVDHRDITHNDSGHLSPKQQANWKDIQDTIKLDGLDADQVREIQRVLDDPSLLDSTLAKGNFAEMVGDVKMAAQGYERLGSHRVTSLDDASHHGLDAIYYKPGDPPEYRIVDQKYGTRGRFELGDTKSGTQMSPQWIRDRLEDYFAGPGGTISAADKAHMKALDDYLAATGDKLPPPARMEVDTRVDVMNGNWTTSHVPIKPDGPRAVKLEPRVKGW